MCACCSRLPSNFYFLDLVLRFFDLKKAKVTSYFLFWISVTWRGSARLNKHEYPKTMQGGRERHVYSSMESAHQAEDGYIHILTNTVHIWSVWIRNREVMIFCASAFSRKHSPCPALVYNYYTVGEVNLKVATDGPELYLRDFDGEATTSTYIRSTWYVRSQIFRIRGNI